ncbi:MAG: type III-A CRISPR-associated protein Cas10/Csm1 [Bacteroidales bacterium]|nr:type III-A CRISPR-associated protein Cas10/Csm1 [Bacteroidales bacterium]
MYQRSIDCTESHKTDTEYFTQLLDVLSQSNPFLQSYADKLQDLVLHNKAPRNSEEGILQLANLLAIGEESLPEGNNTPPLASIFSKLFDVQGKNYGYDLLPLSISGIFPKEDVVITYKDYEEMVRQFLNEAAHIQNETQLYYLLEKYLWCVPASTTQNTDISMFNKAKTTAAIAFCLQIEYEEGILTAEGLKRMTENTDNHFMLINGDLSGIQDFIFNIPSKGAAKSLKSHSVYITLLTDVITRFLIRELGLKEANIIYNGGGNFYILAPRAYKEKFLALKQQISQILLKTHTGMVYIGLDYVLLSPADLMKKFSYHWAAVKEKVNILKNRKWSEIGLQQHYHEIFGPFGVGSEDYAHCQLCGAESEEREITYDAEREKSICSFCASFMDLTNDLRAADCLTIKEVKPRELLTVRDYQDVFRAFGYEYYFTDFQGVSNEDRCFTYVLNDTDFVQQGFAGYRLGAYRLPYNERNKKQLSFEEISKLSCGDQKLALLKLDVDNLGNLFVNGLGNNANIACITALSRMLALFFEGYINYLISKNYWDQYLYVVFSGGDDTFIVGAWDKILEFTQEFYDKFRQFTCYHPQITFSAGIGIYRFDYPIIMSSQLVEEALDNAKNYLNKGQDIPSKNKVSLFGEVFNWAEFAAIRNFKQLLLEIMRNNFQGKGEALGRAFLYKIWKSTLGFRRILLDSLHGRVDNLRFWRLAYYLRDVARKDAEKLISAYRKIVVDNLMEKSTDKQIENIMIIPAAVKWAQMETRGVRGKEDER